ncbi:hypothetical protein QM012_009288 [Aureobasidium pullulans]|uniref:C3H1-type domain-containing protein n=1 Tax=Aureobasidium pullulans TaxID=5580 RepID=A0ABR0THB4_AURPU
MNGDRRGICHAFQQGNCRHGSNCKYRHDIPAENRGPSSRLCRFFNVAQGCRFAKACKFSHDNKAGPTPELNRNVNNTAWHELDKWKKDAAGRQPLGFCLKKFFNQALHLVNLDDASRQDDFETMSDKVLRHILVTQIIPMFRSLSEQRVMSSPLLERHLGTICNVLYGVGGSRGERLFAAVVRALTILWQTPDTIFYTSLEASLAILSKVIEYNSTAKVTPCYETFAITLATMTTPQLDPTMDVLVYQPRKHLDFINKRLGLGKSIKDIASTTNQATGAKPAFNLQRSELGELSNGRPRHDNDSAAIEDIQIMPTSEEIQSTHAEYIPLQDPATWHKQGIDGLLDRHFRLLREDTIGKLRDSARIEFDALQVCDAPCHDAKFCQECANEEIKNRTVDLIMMSSYQDVDLDEEPCIFPTCGHFYTIGTMDGHLRLAEHYVLDANELPVALKVPEDSLDVDKTQIVCPDCRRSLRDIPRYGRVVRRALLIQSTLKFITWSNSEYVALYQRFSETNLNLQESSGEAKPTHVNLLLRGSRDDQMKALRSILPLPRYNECWALKFNIHRFRELVESREQPFKQAQFAALELSWRSSYEDSDDEDDSRDILREEAKVRLAEARLFCDKHSAARAVASEIDEVEKMLRGGTFYQSVTNEEMRKVVAAMATEFSGTGHWWQCENGHPFTIGECGMPIQTAHCPQCGGVIGGQSHQAAAGVAHAEDIEMGVRNMELYIF